MCATAGTGPAAGPDRSHARFLAERGRRRPRSDRGTSGIARRVSGNGRDRPGEPQAWFGSGLWVHSSAGMGDELDGVAGGPIGGVHTMCATIAVQPVWCEAPRPVPTSASKYSLKTGCSSHNSPEGWSRCAPGRRPSTPGRKRSNKRCSMASSDSRLRSPCAIARLRVAVAPLSPGVGRGGVEGPVVLLEAVVVGVPQGDGEVQEAVAVGEPTQTVLTPAVGAQVGVVEGEGVPGVAVVGVVLTDGAPLARAQVGAPASPGGVVRGRVGEPSSLCRGSNLVAHGPDVRPPEGAPRMGSPLADHGWPGVWRRRHSARTRSSGRSGPMAGPDRPERAILAENLFHRTRRGGRGCPQARMPRFRMSRSGHQLGR